MTEQIPLNRELHPDVYKSIEEQKEIARDLINFWSEEDAREGPEFSALMAKDIIALEPSREAIPFIFREAYNTINENTSENTVENTIKILFDIVRSIQDDPELRVVLFAIMAHDIQPETVTHYLDQVREETNQDKRLELINQVAELNSKQKVFEEFAQRLKNKKTLRAFFNDDSENLHDDDIEDILEHHSELANIVEKEENISEKDEQIYSRLCDILLYPSQKSREFLIDFNPDNYTDTAHIITEIELLSTFDTDDIDELNKVFTGNKMRLPPPKMPSLEKINSYIEHTGHLPSPSVTIIYENKKIYIDLDQERADQALKVGELYRQKKISLEERNQQLEQILTDFVESLSPEQQEKITDPSSIGLEIRFTTELSNADPQLVAQYHERLKKIMEEVNQAQESIKKLRTLKKEVA